MKKILLAVFALSLVHGSSMPVYAVTQTLTQTTTMPVSATVVPAVTVSVNSLNFGSALAPGSGFTDVNSAITVNATNGLSYTVTLDAGLYSSGIRRVMSGATSGGYYGLYKDASRSVEWGDSGFANTYNFTGVTGTGNGTDQILAVYGRYQQATGSPIVTFTDTVTVTVNY